jgi:hypothetical protein
MTDSINDRWEDAIRHLQADTLLAEWNLLLDRLAQFGRVTSLAREVHARSEASFLIECADPHLTELDRLVMGCLVIDPHHREEREGGYHITATFRNWWRESVPFLMDPDGVRRYYRYEVREAESLPTEEQ